MDLYNELNKKLEYLDIQIKKLPETGREYAKAYTNYRILLAEELVKLKNEGYAITLAGDIARGRTEIAQAKFKEISAEAIYKANLESINATKLQLKIIQEQLNKEWSNE